MPAGGKIAVAVAMDDGARELARKRRRAADPPPELPREGILPNRKGAPPNWKPNALGLPTDPPCPVQCLGFEGELKHLIDSDGQFRSWTKSDFNQQGIADLFSAMPNYPKWAWPRHGKPYKTRGEDGEDVTHYPIESFKADDVRDALFLACSRAGQFSATDRVRGRGMWRMRSGELIYHAGEELWLFDNKTRRLRVLEPGMHEGHLYPRKPELPAPWDAPIAAADNPAGGLLAGFRKWHWRRPEVDPLLVLGWIGVACLGGALDWRPAVLMLGDRATGKSTLQKAINDIFGAALFHSSDTTAAGIYQKMSQDSRPIALDELEPGDNMQKVRNIVQLMRDSASGSMGRRGGSDGMPSEFQMRSAFLFSAINNPVNSAQDLSRLAVLRLKPLDKDAPREAPVKVDADTCGRKIMALMMREWPRFQKTYDFYKRALAKGGHDNRGQDTYGALLACADMMLGPELAEELEVPVMQTLEGEPDQENSAAIDYWAGALAADTLPEVEGALPNWRKCLETLLTTPTQNHRNGNRPSVGRMLDDVAGTDGGYSVKEAAQDLGDAGLGLKTADDLLQSYARDRRKADINYTVTDAERDLALPRDTGLILAVPSEHPALKILFRDTDWANGSWTDALRQCPIDGVMLTDKAINRVHIAGVQKRCTLVVMKRFNESPER